MTSNHLKHLVRHWIVVPDAANGPVFYPYPIVDNRARILMVLGRLDDARRIFDGSLRMAIAGGDQIKIADTKALIARLHWRRGEYPPADKLFQEALALY